MGPGGAPGGTLAGQCGRAARPDPDSAAPVLRVVGGSRPESHAGACGAGQQAQLGVSPGAGWEKRATSPRGTQVKSLSPQAAEQHVSIWPSRSHAGRSQPRPGLTLRPWLGPTLESDHPVPAPGRLQELNVPCDEVPAPWQEGWSITLSEARLRGWQKQSSGQAESWALGWW